MAITVEVLPNHRIAFVRQVGPYGAANKQVMEKIKRWAEKQGLLESAIIFGIPQDNPEITPPDNCRYDVCLVITEVVQLEEEMDEGIINGGAYVIHKVKHTAEAIQKAWTEIYLLIKESKYQIIDKPILERYTADMIREGYCEICVPVTSQPSTVSAK